MEITRYSVEPTTRKCVKGHGFLSFFRDSSNKYGKQLLDAGIVASKKVIPEVTKATGEFLENKIADAVA